jgi:hypothetical protein
MHVHTWLREGMIGRPQTRCSPVRKLTPRLRPQLEVLEGRRLLSFSSPVGYNISLPGAIAMGDVNGDAKPDLISMYYDSETVVQLGSPWGISMATANRTSWWRTQGNPRRL